MAVEYHLFRAKFIRPLQLSFDDQSLSASEVFTRAVYEKPSLEIKSGSVWHIGNSTPIDSDSGYFAIGKTTSSKC